MKNENKKKIFEHEDNEKEIEENENFELFQKVLTKELVIDLYSLFKVFEKDGLINYNIYIESMIQIFNKYSKGKYYNFQDIFDLIYNRFRKIKCIMKNDKKVFYLTNILPQDQIETYKVVCFLTIFIKCTIIDKIKLLFELSDIDNDGFLNKNEIKQMISTINFMFSEENSFININSTILAQSLMNIRVKEKINSLMNEPGELNVELQKEKYVNFDTFYNSLKRIKNYKYDIFPCFINMKQCLHNKRSEKILEVKNKHKKEFVRASSALSSKSSKPSNPFKNIKRVFSANNLGRIIKNVKIDPNINHSYLFNKKKKLLGIKGKTKSFKELLKESTILSDGEKDNESNSLNEYGMSSSASKRISFHNMKRDKPIYIFEADFDKIKKIEVEPALLKFSDGHPSGKEERIRDKNKVGRYNSTLNVNSHQLKINKNYFYPINMGIKAKRSSIFQLQNKNNLYKTFHIYNRKKDRHISTLNSNFFSNSNSNNNSIYSHSSKNNLNKTFKNSIGNINNNIVNKEKNKFSNKACSSMDNNIGTIKQKTNTNNTNNTKTNLKKPVINKPQKYNKFIYKKHRKFSFNEFINKNISSNKKVSRNKIPIESNKKVVRYLANDIFRDVEKNEEKLRHERTEFISRELLALNKKMILEKKDTSRILGKYDRYDLSLNFFDLKKKRFPKDYGKSIFSFNKFY
jgi:hypothetical protein